ncbi:hypothetical protein J5N97_001161 [Dioscorea zingiberensis]|uniref:Reverse transcriptase domain-containing protein n=1 Tax=Dioscorea zingiberensis TaxID=325984 RepID=A0A9D5H2N6_9LILI|nr:hypothetical protein J5N97_001161 [Dioscorea zingiberensis]
MEKAYDIIRWDVVTAVLTKMSFPPEWLQWTKACIQTTTMAFLINGSSGKWFKPKAGLRQGDPLSSYLFIMVSQVLTIILNKAENLQLFNGVRIKANLNINHTLYADDLLICGKATRKNARSIMMCMELYKSLTGQRPNLTKSDLFLPSWINKRVKLAIVEILKVRQSSFPFKYLGCWISPFRVPIQYFKALVTKVEKKLAHWKTMYLTMAGRVTLANSTLMFIPLFGLSTYVIPNSIIDCITKLVRQFIWSNTGSGNGVHLIGWSTVTSPKTEGGLGVKDLRLMKRALLSKHVLELLNKSDKTWTQLMIAKYGTFDMWQNCNQPKVSWTYRGLLNTAKEIKSNVAQVNITPNNSIWYQPWLFNIPFNRMPTYLNMEIDMTNMQVKDLLTNGQWNYGALESIFSPELAYLILTKQVNPDSVDNMWKWSHNTNGKTCTAAIYEEYRVKCHSSQWSGWKKLWKLNCVPKVSMFLWKFLHGRLPTKSFLFHIGIGPESPCPMCNLSPETISHLFQECRFAQRVCVGKIPIN